MRKISMDLSIDQVYVFKISKFIRFYHFSVAKRPCTPACRILHLIVSINFSNFFKTYTYYSIL